MKAPFCWKLLFLVTTIGSAQADCGTFIHYDQGGDYTNADDRNGLSVVEKFHFTKNVELLIRGETDKLGGDIGYTLEHFPNHHRALAAMAKLALRDKTQKPVGAKYTIDCYFQRAIRFKASDAKVKLLYASYLLSINNSDEALSQLNAAEELDPDNPTLHYNLGLLYFKKNDFVQSRRHAKIAYDQNFPLPGLKEKLISVGQWSAE